MTSNGILQLALFFGVLLLVTKPLGEMLSGIRGIAGATDLGNRRTVLVLDVGAIVEEVLTPTAPLPC